MSILSLVYSLFQVMLGEDIEVPAYSKISLLHQPTTQDSDEELEYADSSHGIVENPCNLFASLLVFEIIVKIILGRTLCG